MSRSPSAPVLVRPDWSVPDSVIAVSTTRSGGCSEGYFAGLNLADHVRDDPGHVLRNRQLLAGELGSRVTFQWLEQAHGTAVVRAGSAGPPPRADALITTVPNLACCVLTADCLPVFFAGLRGDAVGVAHAGWRGLAAGILEATVSALPAPPDEIVAWLGPAIGPCHYEVGDEVRTAMLATAPRARHVELDACFRPTGKAGKYLADLYGLATTRLRHQGVAAISGGGFCTYCQDQRFYSYRRQSETGRMASLIYLKG